MKQITKEKITDVVLIHNILWSHYKAKVFTELYKESQFDKTVDIDFIQIATTQNNRKNLGRVDESLHRYPYQLLFDKSYEDIHFKEKFFALKKAINKKNPKIIITPGYNDPVFWILILLWKIQKRIIIITVDSNYYDHKRVWYKEKFKQLILKSADLIFCYGTMQIEYLKKLKVKSEKIHIRVQATDNDKIREEFLEQKILKPSKAKKKFLYVGRLSKEKNIETLIRAFKNCIQGWELLIVGSGDEEENLKTLVKKEGIANVIFMGPLTWLDIVEIYAKSDVFVLPSLSEPWGLVVNEAMLCELPIIVSKHCGCSKDLVKEGLNGYIFDPMDINQLTSQMNLFVEGTKNTLLMGKKSLEIIESYNPSNAAKQMLKGIKKTK
jgi:glycosyltransferase involved in cell wall biosynthesis